MKEKDKEKTKKQLINKLMKLRQGITELEKIEIKCQQTEEALQYRVEFDDLITAISTNFININLDEIDNEINQALQKIGEFVGVDRSYIFLFSEDEKETIVDNIYEWCAKRIKPQIDYLRKFSIKGELPWWMEKLGRFEIIHIRRVSDLPLEANAEKEMLQLQDIQSLIVVPMICHKSLIGFLGFDSVREEKIWPEEIIALLKIIGEILTNTLERKRTAKELIKTYNELEVRVKERTAELISSNERLQEEIVKHQQTEDALTENEEKFRILVEMAADGIHIETVEGRILECNTAGAKMYGYTKEEMIGLSITDLVPEEFAKTLPPVITEKETTHGIFLPHISKRKDGTIFPTEIVSKIVNIRSKPRLIAYIRDITERKKNEKLKGVLYNISKAANSDISLNQLYPLIHRELNNIIDATNFFIALVNVEKDEISFPYRKDEKDNDFPACRLSRANNLTAYVIRSGQSLLVNQKQIEKMADEGDIKLEHVGIVTAGTHWLGVPLKIKNKIIGAMVVQGYIGPHLFSKKDIQLMEFVSEQVATAIQRKQLEEKLEKLAHFDALTGACNKGYCLGLLNRHIKLAQRNKTLILLAYTDINNFKDINDNFGHKEGDKVLKEVVKLFKSTLREIDIICRVGGDEFLLIFPDSSLKEVPLIRKRINQSLVQLNYAPKRHYKIDISIGFASYNPDNPQSIDELISIADERMYEEKNKRGSSRKIL